VKTSDQSLSEPPLGDADDDVAVVLKTDDDGGSAVFEMFDVVNAL